jgi:hypothetical protein
MVTTPFPTEESPGSAGTADPGSVIEVAEALRCELCQIEGGLRALARDVAEHAPFLAARLNVAAHLSHNAASALASDTVIRAR